MLTTYAISHMIQVVRFNYVPNMLPGEKLDVWVGRSDLLHHSYWEAGDFRGGAAAVQGFAQAKHHVVLGSAAAHESSWQQVQSLS